MRTPLINLFVFSFLFATAAEASDCGQAGQPPAVYLANFKLKRITGYIPSLGGINGKSGQSASGVSPDNHSYEKFEKGKSKFVMVAVPQRGSVRTKRGGQRSRYFKSMTRVPAIEAKSGRCTLFFAGDHYGKSSNWAGEFGKMDIVHDQPYKNAMRFNEIQNSTVYVVSGVQTIKNKRIDVIRLIEAVKPLLGPQA